ncbi:PqqD family peptide modification chaperone [Terrabacter terrigena]|uniref:PqqD family peptide modification chaperone n=1 Tax=Terrabacter terrigena TaxID=574718 RepID=A0ABW3MVA4_9MICO
MSAAYRAARDVGVTMGHDDLLVYLARLPDGPVMVLEGVAALIWVEATTHPAAGWVGRVAEAVREPEERIVGDVKAFVQDLRERDLVEPVPSPGT